RDEVAGAYHGAADEVVATAVVRGDADAVSERRRSGRVGADPVALDEIVTSAACAPREYDGLSRSGDHIARAGSRAADRVAVAENSDPNDASIRKRRRSAGVRAEVVPLDEGASRVHEEVSVPATRAPGHDVTLRGSLATEGVRGPGGEPDARRLPTARRGRP